MTAMLTHLFFDFLTSVNHTVKQTFNCVKLYELDFAKFNSTQGKLNIDVVTLIKNPQMKKHLRV